MCNNHSYKKRDFSAELAQLKVDIQRYGWLNVLRELTPLDDCLELGSKGSKKGDYCPGHDSKSGENFRLMKTAEEDGAGYCYVCAQQWDGFGIIMEFDSCDFNEACNKIRGLIYGPDGQPKIYEGDTGAKSTVKPKVYEPKEPTEEDWQQHEKVMKDNAALWKSSFPLENAESEVGRLYFEGRSIFNYASLGGNVRFNPSVEYTVFVKNEKRPEKMAAWKEKVEFLRGHPYYYREWKTPSGDIVFYMGHHPCLVFLMRDPKDFVPKTIQRIYLSPEGKKIDFDGLFGLSCKKRMPASPVMNSVGTSVLIDPPGTPIVGVAEGPETALAVRGALEIPMHCTIDAGGLENYECVGGTYTVVIFADKDVSKRGQTAAEALAERLRAEHVEVLIKYPPMDIPEGSKGVDWQDAVEQLGEAAFDEQLLNWETL